MVNAIQDPDVEEVDVGEGSDDEPLICDCGHTFGRYQLDVRVNLDIVYEGREDDFDIADYRSERNECPTCSCCSMEDDSIRRDEDEVRVQEAEQAWFCSVCGLRYEGEDSQYEANACCAQE